MFARMNTYRIDPAGDLFQVVKTAADGKESVVSGHLSEAAAQIWLTDLLQRINMAELTRWIRTRAAGQAGGNISSWTEAERFGQHRA